MKLLIGLSLLLPPHPNACLERVVLAYGRGLDVRRNAYSASLAWIFS